jgi:hypothetical protein
MVALNETTVVPVQRWRIEVTQAGDTCVFEGAEDSLESILATHLAGCVDFASESYGEFDVSIIIKSRVLE